MRIKLGALGSVAAGTSARLGNSALRPFPKALRGPSGGLFIGEYLLGQLYITFGPLGADIVSDNRLAVTGSFGQTHVSRDNGSKDLVFEERPEIVGDLFGEGGAVVKHGKQDAL